MRGRTRRCDVYNACNPAGAHCGCRYRFLGHVTSAVRQRGLSCGQHRNPYRGLRLLASPMRSLPVRDHWCASFHLATVLAAVGHRSCGRGVCVWCARRSRLRGLTPSRVCGRHPVGRAGGCLPGGYPQGLPTGANTPKRTPQKHTTKPTPREPFQSGRKPPTTHRQQPTTTTTMQPSTTGEQPRPTLASVGHAPGATHGMGFDGNHAPTPWQHSGHQPRTQRRDSRNQPQPCCTRRKPQRWRVRPRPSGCPKEGNLAPEQTPPRAACQVTTPTTTTTSRDRSKDRSDSRTRQANPWVMEDSTNRQDSPSHTVAQPDCPRATNCPDPNPAHTYTPTHKEERRRSRA